MILDVIILTLTLLTVYGSLDCSMDSSATKLFSESPGGRLKYYTNIANYISLLAFFIGLIHRKNFIYSYFMTIGLSLQTTLVIFYWGIQLVIPDAFSRAESIKVSRFTDFCQHLFPFFCCLLSPFTLFSRYRFCITSLFGIGVSYVIYIHHLRVSCSDYTYPFLKKIGNFYILFYLFLIFTPIAVFKVIYLLKGPVVVKKIKKE